MDVINATASGLFVSRGSQQAQLENLAQRQLSAALEQFVDKKYDESIATFKRAIALAPLSTTATSAYDYMARAYLSKEDVQSAIAAYRESLRGNPTDANAHFQLGSIYVTQGDMANAKASYQAAVRLDPSSANRYALGQSLMELGEYRAAEEQFRAVKNQEPGKPNGDYGLGLVYARQGRVDEAEQAFQQAISQQKDFWFAHIELGYLKVDKGEFDAAQSLADGMRGKADDLADTLEQYIFEKTPAEMVARYTSVPAGSGGVKSEFERAADMYSAAMFQSSLGPRTTLTSLDPYLATPGAQKTFSMIFAFNKPMDAQSVENVLNWNISRATQANAGSTYNYGMPVPSTEVRLNANPVSVVYDEKEQTAMVLFRVTQNADGNGTLDPSHIRFSFAGEDAVGYRISQSADEFTGVRGFA
jgi:tetratricopeptide (TPR) repeat protein